MQSENSPLRCYSVNVPREHRAFLDVGNTEEASRDTLEADGEAAVRGHAVYLRASLLYPLCPLRCALRARSAHTAHPRL